MSWIITGTEKNPVDLYRSQVSLLLHGDGTNGSTTIVDSSPSPKTVTVFGDAQISTAVADPFGSNTGVIAFDGNGDFLNTTAGDFGTGDFTVEMWIYIVSYPQLYVSLIGTRPLQTSYIDRWTLALNSSRLLIFYTNTFRISHGSISTGVWTHVAVSRQGVALRGFINGTLVHTNTDTLQNFTHNSLYIGNNSSNTEPLDGYIDDLRITKGVARYTSNFTPPTAPFPDA